MSVNQEFVFLPPLAPNFQFWETPREKISLLILPCEIDFLPGQIWDDLTNRAVFHK
jgi:hypothetical protein